MSEYPALSRLFHGFLGLDWPEESGSVDAAIAEFVSDRVEDVEETMNQLQELIQRQLPESDLISLAESLGCGYWPHGDGLTYQQWLPELLAAIQAHGTERRMCADG